MSLLEDEVYDDPVQGLLDEQEGGRPFTSPLPSLPSGFVTPEQVSHASKQKSIAHNKQSEIRGDRNSFLDTEFKDFFDEVMTPKDSPYKASDHTKEDDRVHTLESHLNAGLGDDDQRGRWAVQKQKLQGYDNLLSDADETLRHQTAEYNRLYEEAYGGTLAEQRARKRILDRYEDDSSSDIPRFLRTPDMLDHITGTTGMYQTMFDSANRAEYYSTERRAYHEKEEELIAQGAIVSNNGYQAGSPLGVSPEERAVLRDVMDQGPEKAAEVHGHEAVADASLSNAYHRANLDFKRAKHNYMRLLANDEAPEDKLKEALGVMTVAKRVFEDRLAQAAEAGKAQDFVERARTGEDLMNVREVLEDSGTDPMSFFGFGDKKSFVAEVARGGLSKAAGGAESAAFANLGVMSPEEWAERAVARGRVDQRRHEGYKASGFVTTPSEWNAIARSDASLLEKGKATTDLAVYSVVDLISSLLPASLVTGTTMAWPGKKMAEAHVQKLAEKGKVPGRVKKQLLKSAPGGAALWTAMASLEAGELRGIIGETPRMIEGKAHQVDIFNEQDLVAAISDPAYMAKVKKQMYGRQVIVPAFDLVSWRVGAALGGLGGKATSKLGVGKSWLPKMGAATGVVLGDSAMGGTGEIAGRAWQYNVQGRPGGTFAKLRQVENPDKEGFFGWTVDGYLGKHMDDVWMEALAGVPTHMVSAGMHKLSAVRHLADAVEEGRVAETERATRMSDFGMTEEEIRVESGETSTVTGHSTVVEGSVIETDAGTTGKIDGGKGLTHTYNTFNDRRDLVLSITSRFGVSDNRTQAFLDEFFSALEGGDAAALQDLKVVYTNDFGQAADTNTTQGYYDTKTNTLYLNTNKNAAAAKANFGSLRDPTAVVDSEAVATGEAKVATELRDLTSMLVHEASHFAEKFGLVDNKLIDSEYEAINASQKDRDGVEVGQFVAFLNYDTEAAKRAFKDENSWRTERDAFYKAMQEDTDFRDNYKSEWFAYQLAREVRGKVKAYSKGVKGLVEKVLSIVRPMVKSLIGDASLSTDALNSAIAEMLDPENRGSQAVPEDLPESAGVTDVTATPAPQETVTRVDVTPTEEAAPAPAPATLEGTRTWTSKDGTKLSNARLKDSTDTEVTLETAEGDYKIPLSELSDADRQLVQGDKPATTKPFKPQDQPVTQTTLNFQAVTPELVVSPKAQKALDDAGVTAEEVYEFNKTKRGNKRPESIQLGPVNAFLKKKKAEENKAAKTKKAEERAAKTKKAEKKAEKKVEKPVVQEVPKPSSQAQKLADKEGVDISKLTGTGAKGRVTVKDVRSAVKPAEKKPAEKKPAEKKAKKKKASKPKVAHPISIQAEKVAEQRGIDLTGIPEGTGKNGKIIVRDVLAHGRKNKVSDAQAKREAEAHTIVPDDMVRHVDPATQKHTWMEDRRVTSVVTDEDGNATHAVTFGQNDLIPTKDLEIRKKFVPTDKSESEVEKEAEKVAKKSNNAKKVDNKTKVDDSGGQTEIKTDGTDTVTVKRDKAGRLRFYKNGKQVSKKSLDPAVAQAAEKVAPKKKNPERAVTVLTDELRNKKFGKWTPQALAEHVEGHGAVATVKDVDGKTVRAIMKELGLKVDKSIGIRGNLERLAEFVNKGVTSGVNETTSTYKGQTLMFKSPQERRLWEYAVSKGAGKKEAKERLEAMGVNPDEIDERSKQVKEAVERAREGSEDVTKLLISSIHTTRFSKKIAEEIHFVGRDIARRGMTRDNRDRVRSLIRKHDTSYEELDRDFPILSSGRNVGEIAEYERRAKPVYTENEVHGLRRVIEGSGWQKVGDRLGSNPGGTYVASDGQLHYVKQSRSEAHAKNELLASRLYELADGYALPMQGIDTGSGLGTASLWRADLRPFSPYNPDHVREARKDFAVHAWLANWDAVGLVNDNLMVDPDGDVMHVDPGGALLYRAQGEPKGHLWNADVSEWNVLRDPGMNAQSAAVFGGMTPLELYNSTLKLERVTDSMIDSAVQEFSPKETATETAKILKQRRDTILAKGREALQTEGIRRSKAFYATLNWEGKGTDLQETASVEPFTIAEARLRIAETTNEVGRNRDTRILKDVDEWLNDPFAPEAEEVEAGWSGDVNSVGTIIVTADGSVVLREVANEFDGYKWTFAKGKRDEGESLRDTAMRETREEMGIGEDTPGFDIVGALPKAYGGGTGKTLFYIARIEPSITTRGPNWGPAPAWTDIEDDLDAQFLDHLITPKGPVKPRSDTKKVERVVVSAVEDKKYADAVKRGDTKTAERMVRDVAKEAGYTVEGYHSGPDKINIFSADEVAEGYRATGAFYFADNRDASVNFAKWRKPSAEPHTVSAFLKMGKTKKYDSFWRDFAMEKGREGFYDELRRQGYDSIEVGHDAWMDDSSRTGKASVGKQYIILNKSENIKSAEPVTYDDSGKMIPLSERFNPRRTDIRYAKSVGGKKLPDNMHARTYPKLVSLFVNKDGSPKKDTSISVRKVLSVMAKEHQVPEVRRVVRRLLKVMPKETLNIPVITDRSILGMGATNEEDTKYGFGVFSKLVEAPDPNEADEVYFAKIAPHGAVWLNPDFLRPDGVPAEEDAKVFSNPEYELLRYQGHLGEESGHSFTSVLLHEIIHAATVGQVRENPNDALVLELETLAKQYWQFGEHGHQGMVPTSSYGFTNIHEFLAEAFSNPDFQRELRMKNLSDMDTDVLGAFRDYNDQPLSGTLWDKVVEFVRELFKLPKSDDVVERIMDLTYAVASTPSLPVQELPMWASLDPRELKRRQDVGLGDYRMSKPINTLEVRSPERKEWEEKGTDSKFFKKWFGKGQHTLPSGKPVVFLHGGSLGMMRPDRTPWTETGMRPWEAADRKSPERTDRPDTDIVTDERNVERPIFLTESPEFAQAYQPDDLSTSPSNPAFKPLKFYTNVTKTFDFENSEHVDRVLDLVVEDMPDYVQEFVDSHEYELEEIAEALAHEDPGAYPLKVFLGYHMRGDQSNWMLLESMTAVIRKAGFDSLFVSEMDPDSNRNSPMYVKNLAVLDAENVKLAEDVDESGTLTDYGNVNLNALAGGQDIGVAYDEVRVTRNARVSGAFSPVKDVRKAPTIQTVKGPREHQVPWETSNYAPLYMVQRSFPHMKSSQREEFLHKISGWGEKGHGDNIKAEQLKNPIDVASTHGWLGALEFGDEAFVEDNVEFIPVGKVRTHSTYSQTVRSWSPTGRQEVIQAAHINVNQPIDVFPEEKSNPTKLFKRLYQDGFFEEYVGLKAEAWAYRLMTSERSPPSIDDLLEHSVRFDDFNILPGQGDSTTMDHEKFSRDLREVLDIMGYDGYRVTDADSSSIIPFRMDQIALIEDPVDSPSGSFDEEVLGKPPQPLGTRVPETAYRFTIDVTEEALMDPDYMEENVGSDVQQTSLGAGPLRRSGHARFDALSYLEKSAVNSFMYTHPDVIHQPSLVPAESRADRPFFEKLQAKGFMPTFDDAPYLPPVADPKAGADLMGGVLGEMLHQPGYTVSENGFKAAERFLYGLDPAKDNFSRNLQMIATRMFGIAGSERFLDLLERLYTPRDDFRENAAVALSLMMNAMAGPPAPDEQTQKWVVWEAASEKFVRDHPYRVQNGILTPNRVGDPVIEKKLAGKGRPKMVELVDEAAWLFNRTYGAGSPHRAHALHGIFNKDGSLKDKSEWKSPGYIQEAQPDGNVTVSYFTRPEEDHDSFHYYQNFHKKLGKARATARDKARKQVRALLGTDPIEIDSELFTPWERVEQAIQQVHHLEGGQSEMQVLGFLHSILTDVHKIKTAPLHLVENLESLVHEEPAVKELLTTLDLDADGLKDFVQLKEEVALKQKEKILAKAFASSVGKVAQAADAEQLTKQEWPDSLIGTTFHKNQLPEEVAAERVRRAFPFLTEGETAEVEKAHKEFVEKGYKSSYVQKALEGAHFVTRDADGLLVPYIFNHGGWYGTVKGAERAVLGKGQVFKSGEYFDWNKDREDVEQAHLRAYDQSSAAWTAGLYGSYHTKGPTDEQGVPEKNYMMFQSPDSGTASAFGNNIPIPVILLVKNPFDFENHEHVERVLPFITDQDTAKHLAGAISLGAYSAIEDQRFIDAIKDAGFDSMHMKEYTVDAHKNIAVFDPASHVKLWEDAWDEARRTAEGVATFAEGVIPHPEYPDTSAQRYTMAEGTSKYKTFFNRIVGGTFGTTGNKDLRLSKGIGVSADFTGHSGVLNAPKIEENFSLSWAAATSRTSSAWDVLFKGAGKFTDRLREASQTLMDPVRRRLQDRMIYMKRLVESVEQESGGRLPDTHQTYVKHELHYGKIGSDMAHIQENFEMPLQDHILKHKLDIDLLDNWLQYRHGLERNTVVRRRTKGINQHGSGFSDRALLGTDTEMGLIDQFREDNPNWEEYEKAAHIIDKLNRWSLDMKRKYQIISDKDYDQLTGAYSYWVPLRGFEDASSYLQDDPRAAETRAATGTGVNQLKNTGPKYATGLVENQNVTDIVAWSLALARQSAIESRKNEVMLSFYDLVRQGQAQGMNLFSAEEIVPKKKRINPETGEATYYIDPFWKDQPNVVGLRLNGETVAMELPPDLNTGESTIARALKNGGPEQAGILTKLARPAIRYLAAINTTFNLPFMVSNFTRDTQAAFMSLQGLEADIQVGDVKSLAKEVRKEVFNIKRMAASVAGGVLATARGKSFWEGKSKAAQEWAGIFKDFEKAGGRTHFYGLDSIEDTAKKFADEVQSNPNKPKKALKYLGRFFDNYNAAVENGVRVSVYKSLIDRGVSKQKAANVARNLTVNFNRKGEWGSTLSNMYLFANASIQGSAKLLTLAGKSKKVQALLGGQIAMGFMVALMNRLIGGEDEDDENRWETGVNRYEKYHNWVVMLPEGGVELPAVGKVSRIKVPQPYGYNVFWAMGVAAEELMNGKSRKAGDVALEMLSVAATAFNPIGATESWLTTITPTLARPFVEHGLNEDYAGRPIFPETQAPPHQQYFNSVSGTSKAATEWLNKASGGHDVRPGSVSINPELIDHYAGFVGGGAATTAIRSSKLMSRMFTEKEKPLEPNDIPIARRFIAGEADFYDQNLYYELRGHMRLAEDVMKSPQAMARPDFLTEIYPREFKKAMFYKYMLKTDNQLSAVKRQITALDKDESISPRARWKKKEKLYKFRRSLIVKTLQAARRQGLLHE